MMMEIIIKAGSVTVTAQLNDTKTAKAIYEALPLEGNVQLWGEEIYFTISLELELENGSAAEVEKGDCAYWPLGPAFCIFFGKTPVSTGDKPVAYSPVNVFARITGDLDSLAFVKEGTKIIVESKKI